jgi:hypothetical protein
MMSPFHCWARPLTTHPLCGVFQYIYSGGLQVVVLLSGAWAATGCNPLSRMHEVHGASVSHRYGCNTRPRQGAMTDEYDR